MALEEKVLAILGRRAATWDQLRGELGAAPDELDAAIQALKRTRAVHRDRGRFHLNGAAPKSTTEGGVMATKACGNCGETKSTDEFPKKGAQCKACIAAKAKAWYQAKRGAPTRSKAKASAPARRAKASRTSSTPPLAPGASGPLGVLHFNDGVRIGPMHASVSGILQFKSFIDLSAAQLDELATWWRAARGAA